MPLDAQASFSSPLTPLKRPHGVFDYGSALRSPLDKFAPQRQFPAQQRRPQFLTTEETTPKPLWRSATKITPSPQAFPAEPTRLAPNSAPALHDMCSLHFRVVQAYRRNEPCNFQLQTVLESVDNLDALSGLQEESAEMLLPLAVQWLSGSDPDKTSFALGVLVFVSERFPAILQRSSNFHLITTVRDILSTGTTECGDEAGKAQLARLYSMLESCDGADLF
eukprot:TRINITY_DN4422_c0_g1_i2.p2 TRINITY_DN4422_c0_g1~~TRINITY_DN4422_c0_g1_i2.p2  ORF type:complete len:222 (+),score=42.78 TRINITY_DN4422_c0_g1_i2:503-1168(+)